MCYDEFLLHFGRSVAGSSDTNSFLKNHLSVNAEKHRRMQIQLGLAPKKYISAAVALEEITKRAKSRSVAIAPIFRQYDDDNSGTIEIGEFREALSNFNLYLTDDEFAKLICRVDTSNDGLIDYKEFAALLA